MNLHVVNSNIELASLCSNDSWFIVFLPVLSAEGPLAVTL